MRDKSFRNGKRYEEKDLAVGNWRRAMLVEIVKKYGRARFSSAMQLFLHTIIFVESFNS